MTDRKKCENCRFFDAHNAAEEDEEGYCRRHSPRPVVTKRDGMTDDPNDVVAWWPVVLSSDWCGDFAG